jgi:hypothetical protein
MNNRSTFSNAIGLPEELVPLLVESTWACEYASLKRNDTPITTPLTPFAGEDGRTIDIATGLTYPWKAERARSNSRVCLLYSESKALTVEMSPVVLVYGQATVYDSDLQANTERYTRESRARSKMFRQMPPFLLNWMTSYLARIWIAVTPLRVLWWPEGDMEKIPQHWRAPEGTQAPTSDPPPKPLHTLHEPLNTPPADWRKDIAYAFDQLGAPILTVVDEDGYRVPFRVRGGSLRAGGVYLDLLSTMPTKAKGRACLTFHTIQVQNGEMFSNENMSFIGDVYGDGNGALFKVERQLPCVSFKRGLKDMLSLVLTMGQLGKRLEVEAARRGQPVPTVRLTG